jgi:FKBP-type peptidyl-prolyl cis-trans isomerase (trigger factor)
MTKTPSAKKPAKTVAETPATPAKKPLIAANTPITITIPAKEATEAYGKALKKLSKRVKHPGFRVGKVPAKIAEEILGQSSIIESALDTILPQAYQEALAKSGKKPLTQPSVRPVSLELGKDWELIAEIAERPEIKIAEYQKIAKKALSEAQKELQKQVTEAKAAHEKAQKEAKKTQKTDTKTTPAPESPAFKEPSKEQEQDFLVQKIYQALILELKPAIPELLVREEVRYDLDELTNQLEPLKMSLEEYMQKRNLTEQQLSNELAARALGRLQITLLLQEIAKEIKAEVTQEAIDAAITETKNPEMIAQQKNQQYRNLVEQTLMRKVVAEHLLKL